MVFPLDSALIPKFVTELAVPPVYEPTLDKSPLTGKVRSHNYTIYISQFKQQILPEGFPQTPVWGYGGKVRDPETDQIIDFRGTPGATFEATRRIPVNVQWINELHDSHSLPVDPTLHWADPNEIGMPMPPFDNFPPGFPFAQFPIPIVTHLHGGETESASDGHPEAWFTADEDKKGPAFVKSRYHYANGQEPTALWYHDHALGLTRLNVLMGLAGFYLLRDPNHPLDKRSSPLPKGKYEIPMVIQDRSFNEDGSFAFPTTGVNPEVHPYWVPEFFGNIIMVNGKVWPNLKVEPRQYRFRILNGSNARFYRLKFSNGLSFIQIGSDGGYLRKPVKLVSLLLAPGERADILVDFSTLLPGSQLILENDAPAPYPTGDMPDPLTVGQVLQFTVLDMPVIAPDPLPAMLNLITTLFRGKKRTHVLYEVSGPKGPLSVLLDGQTWSAPPSELPFLGITEDWEIVNLTMDAHPIHLHLVQFQIVSRQDLETARYTQDWLLLNNQPPLYDPMKVLPVKPYLLQGPIKPLENERGWKDTVKVFPGQVTTIRVRFAPQNAPLFTIPGLNLYPFDAAKGPGYVWHCHILDHEDNEMMRPLKPRDYWTK